jgi:hypothetical protein
MHLLVYPIYFFVSLYLSIYLSIYLSVASITMIIDPYMSKPALTCSCPSTGSALEWVLVSPLGRSGSSLSQLDLIAKGKCKREEENEGSKSNSE